jgi:hypothetical protein
MLELDVNMTAIQLASRTKVLQQLEAHQVAFNAKLSDAKSRVEISLTSVYNKRPADELSKNTSKPIDLQGCNFFRTSNFKESSLTLKKKVYSYQLKRVCAKCKVVSSTLLNAVQWGGSDTIK